MGMAFVLSADRKPLDPCHPARARQLLRSGKAAILRRDPFTIILKERTASASEVHAHRMKIDPGSKVSGLAVVQEQTGRVVWAAELAHRGAQIRDALLSRRSLRRGRRNRKTRYRAQRGLSKSHWLDASCVGSSTPKHLRVRGVKPLPIRARGHGRRQRCKTDKYGFPVGHAPRAKSYLGYQTGDLVRAEIPKGKYAGLHVGRLVIRFRPNFRLKGFDVHPKYLHLLQRNGGYEYGCAE